MNVASTVLTKDKIKTILQSTCNDFTASQHRWTFAPATSLLTTPRNKVVETGQDTIDPSTLEDEIGTFHGIVAHEKLSSSSSEETTTSSVNAEPSLATFYLAYSTWDGRVLFRDYTTSMNENNEKQEPTDQSNTPPLSKLWYHLLARVAVGLGCNRLVWAQQRQQQVPNFPKNDTTFKPKQLSTWLTLHWNLPELQMFTKNIGNHDGFVENAKSSNMIRKGFSMALEEQNKQQRNSINNRASQFSLRLAESSDVHHITRLVRGLAEFENELDSINVKPEQTALDGFEGDCPLYYCVLIDCVFDKEGSSNTADATTSSRTTCGMAFCYFGHHYEAGRFLYLEDLFIEEKYRGQGCGTFVMGALALASQYLNCTKMVWQALDWNTPALNFYGKIGAKVQSDLLTCRFKGSGLQDFAKSPVEQS